MNDEKIISLLKNSWQKIEMLDNVQVKSKQKCVRERKILLAFLPGKIQNDIRKNRINKNWIFDSVLFGRNPISLTEFYAFPWNL